MAKAALEVSFGGRVFPHWNSLSIVTSIEAAAANLSVEFPLSALSRVATGTLVSVDLVSEETESALANLAHARPRRKQFRKRMFTGWVEVLKTSFGDAGATAVVSGRSLSGLFIQSAPDIEPGEWLGVTIAEIAQDLSRAIAPEGLPRIWRDYDEGEVDELTGVAFDLPVLERFTLTPGESAWSAIERGCRLSGLIAYPSPGGDLLFSQPATRLRESAAEMVLQEGRNVLQATLTRDVTDRFSRYVVRGQKPGSDAVYGADAAGPEGVAVDEGIAYLGRHDERLPIETKKIVIAEGAVDAELCALRASWECSVAYARSNELQLRLAGLLLNPDYAGSGFWQVNRLIRTKLPTLGIEDTYLISDVTYTASRDAGAMADLVLKDRRSLIRMPAAPVDPFAEELRRLEDEEDLL